MKIKILELSGYEYGYDDYSQTGYIAKNITEWDEVSKEDYDVLREWVQDKNRTAYQTKTLIISEADIDIPATVAMYKEKAKAVIQKKKEAEQKQKEREKKRQATTEKKKAEREKKILERLKSKYEKQV